MGNSFEGKLCIYCQTPLTKENVSWRDKQHTSAYNYCMKCNRERKKKKNKEKYYKFLSEHHHCERCGCDLTIDNIAWKDKSRGFYYNRCIDCDDTRKFEEKFLPLHPGKKHLTQKEIKEDIIAAFKKSGCKKCGESRDYVLDAHHKKPDSKNHSISDMTRNSCSIKELNEELDKCIVLCANCHREFHHFYNQAKAILKEYE